MYVSSNCLMAFLKSTVGGCAHSFLLLPSPSSNKGPLLWMAIIRHKGESLSRARVAFFFFRINSRSIRRLRIIYLGDDKFPHIGRCKTAQTEKNQTLNKWNKKPGSPCLCGIERDCIYCLIVTYFQNDKKYEENAHQVNKWSSRVAVLQEERMVEICNGLQYHNQHWEMWTKT